MSLPFKLAIVCALLAVIFYFCLSIFVTAISPGIRPHVELWTRAERFWVALATTGLLLTGLMAILALITGVVTA